MYNINGVALDNPTMNWILRAPTQPLSEHSVERINLKRPKRHGVVGGLGGTFSAVTMPFVVQTDRANLETLQAVFAPEGTIQKTGDASRSIEYELISTSPVGFGAADEVVDVTFLLRLPGVFWRSSGVVTSPIKSLVGASEPVMNILPGLSVAVQDAIVRVKGQTQGLQITDSGGSWLTYTPEIPAGSYFRFEADTNRAFVTTSNSWSGGTEVSGLVDFGGPRGLFELTPTWSTDPKMRAAQLNVATALRVGAEIQVRGRSAHLV